MGCKERMKTYVADFETTTTKDKTRVWAWGQCEVGNVENFKYGTEMEEFIRWCEKGANKKIMFHNLAFDGEFIFSWLLNNGFRYDRTGAKQTRTFNCIISKTGEFYQIQIIFKKYDKKYKQVTIEDSFKKIPFQASKIQKDFGLDIGKIEVPPGFYEWDRPPGHKLTEFEIAYLKHDVQVVALALGLQYAQDMPKMTTGADALYQYKKTLGGGDFKAGDALFKGRYFPVLSTKVDLEIREAYKGGYTYLKKGYSGKDLGKGVVFDVNSLYPWAMFDQLLPYGEPLPFKGQYTYDEFYPLYIQAFSCTFRLKEGHLPTLQVKGGRFVETQYLETSIDDSGNDEPVDLVLTSVDLELFLEHYDVEEMEYDGGYMFKGTRDLFKEYILKWMEVKGRKGISPSERFVAKLMLNSLYGKFATSPDVTGRYPEMNEDGSISYHDLPEKLRDPIYTAMGCFITAYARKKTITTGQSVYDRFVYADTDSLHLVGEEFPDIEIHESDLGAWKFEGAFSRARFVRAKTYIEDIDGLHVTCAGMPDNVKQLVTWDNFREWEPTMYAPCQDGRFFGKLTRHHVPGGIVLIPDYFTIKRQIA